MHSYCILSSYGFFKQILVVFTKSSLFPQAQVFDIECITFCVILSGFPKKISFFSHFPPFINFITMKAQPMCLEMEMFPVLNPNTPWYLENSPHFHPSHCWHFFKRLYGVSADAWTTSRPSQMRHCIGSVISSYFLPEFIKHTPKPHCCIHGCSLTFPPPFIISEVILLLKQVNKFYMHKTYLHLKSDFCNHVQSLPKIHSVNPSGLITTHIIHRNGKGERQYKQ